LLQHSIPQERVRKFYDTIVKTQKLNSADALKLKGRVQFTAGELFGRVAKTSRLVSLSLSQTWTVFADASYKQEIEGDQSLPLEAS